MSRNDPHFLDGLGEYFTGTEFSLTKKTPTGRNILVIPPHGVEITVNYVDSDKEHRLSVKLTVNRGTKGGPTPKFDGIAARHKAHASQLLDGLVTWESKPEKTESKVQVERNLAYFKGDRDAMYKWVDAQARVLRAWAEEIE